MKRFKPTAIALAFFAAALFAGASFGAGSPNFYWRSGSYLIPHTYGTGPGSGSGEGPGETAQQITLTHDMPAYAVAGSQYSAHLTANGNDGRPLTYAASSAPSFITVLPNGALQIAPSSGDVGTHPGIIFTVSDGTTTFSSSPFTMQVTAAADPGGEPVADDSMPDSFSLPAVVGAEPSSMQSASGILIAGINVPVQATVSASGAKVPQIRACSAPAADCGQWSGSVTVSNGQYLDIRVVAEDSFSSSSAVELRVGEFAAQWTVSTRAVDLVPDQFTIATVSEADPGTVQTASGILASGFDGELALSGVPATSNEPQFRVCAGPSAGCGPWAASVSISSGQYFDVRVTAESGFSASNAVTVALGDFAVQWTVSTRAAHLDPDQFTIAAVSDAQPGTVQTATGIPVSGFETALTLSGTATTSNKAEFRVCSAPSAGCGDWAASVSVSSGQYFDARVVAENTFSATNTVTVELGGRAAQWTVSTRAADLDPDTFTIAAVSAAQPGAVQTASGILASGFDTQLTLSGTATTANKPEFRVCTSPSTGCGEWAASVSISSGQYFDVRVTAESAFSASNAVTVALGDFAAQWNVFTRAVDLDPDPFTIADVSSAQSGTVQAALGILASGFDTQLALSGTATTSNKPEFRVCSALSSNCGAWAANVSVSAGQYFDVRVTAESAFSATNTVTVALGGYSTTWTVSSAAQDASTVMATNFSNDGVAVDYRTFYDGSTASAGQVSVAVGKSLVVDFGTPVSFSSAYISFGGAQNVRIEYESNGQWVVPSSGASASTSQISDTYAGSISMGQTVVARRIRAVNTGSSALTLRELRIGNGPAHAAPVIDQSGVIATLGASPMSVTLTATVNNNYGNVTGNPVFTVVSGSLPDGAVLDPTGLLSLPSQGSTSGWAWTPTIRVADGAGFTSEKVLQITTPAASASQALPVSVTVNGTAINPGLLYDGVTATQGGMALSAGQYVVIDFGRQVKFTNASYGTTGSGAFSIQYEVNGTFQTDLAGSYSGAGTTSTYSERTTQRVRLLASAALNVNEFRLGNGSIQASPTLAATSPASLPVALGPTAKSVQLSVNWPSSAYMATTTRNVALLSGALPAGASLSSGGLLTLPAAGAGTAIWDVTVRATDSTGFYADEKVRILQNVPDASSVVAVSVTRSSGTNLTSAEKAILYDESSSVNFSNGEYFDVDFGQTVTASAVYVYAQSTKVEYQPDGTSNWIALGSFSYTTTRASFGTVAARKFRLTNTTGTGTVGGLRVGDGPKPVATIDQSGTIATLQAGTTSSVQLTGSASTAYGPADPLTWSLVNALGVPSGNSLSGVSLSSAGLLQLPARPATTDTSYNVKVKVLDAHGFATTKTLTVLRQ